MFIQVRPSGTMISYTNRKNGDAFNLAKSEQIAKAAFKETMDNELIAKNPTLAAKVSSMIQEAGSEYSWVDQKGVDDFFKENKSLLRVEEPSQVCNTVSTNLSYGRTTAGNDELISTAPLYPSGSIISVIGKREVRLAMYDYDGVSDYDWGVCFRVMYYSIGNAYDERFKNLLLTIDEYRVKNGEPTLDGIKITSAEFAWNNGENSDDKVKSFNSYMYNRFSGRMQGNYKHLLLSRNNSFANGIAGIATTGANVAMANVWSVLNRFVAPSHEFGHLLSATHTSTCDYGTALGYWSWYADLMSPGDIGCFQVYYHASSSNRDKIDAHLSANTYCNEVLDKVVELPAIANKDYAQDLMTTTGITANKAVWLGASKTDQYRYNKGLYFLGFSDISIAFSNGSTPGAGPRGCMDHIYVYKVKFPQYNYYMIKTVTTNGDPILTLLDKNGNCVASDDNSGGGLKSKISGYFNADWYYIIVGGYMNKPHNFSLTVRYGWWEGGNWRASTGGQNNNNNTPPINTPINEAIDKGDGNIIYEADFGQNSKMKNENSSNLPNSEMKIKSYPNPATNQLSIVVPNYSGNISYELFDISGRKVLARKINYATVKTISLKGIKSGTYILNIKGDNLKSSEKIVIIN